MKKLAVIICVLVLASSFKLHKYYHSHCSMEISSKTGNTEAVLELFWHDVEVSLSKKNGKAIKIDDKDINTLLEDYLKENFVLKSADGKSITFSYVGSEIKRDEINIYIEYKDLQSFEGLSLTNSLLVREFPQQVNKVNLKKGEWKKSLVYTSKALTQKLPS